jgi:hypothetical protein
MMLQSNEMPNDDEVTAIKREIHNNKSSTMKNRVSKIEGSLSSETLRAVRQTQEKGASNWLSVIPLEEHGFVLNKGEFRDAISLRYNKSLQGLLSKCPCGENYNVTHALNCKKGGFVTIRHNNLRNFEANLLRKVHNDVELEPALQPLEGEHVKGISGDEARPDVRARGVWRPGQNAFFDIRVTNPNAQSQIHLSNKQIFQKHEKEKKRNYNDRVMNIEHGTFTPLIFSTNGGEGPECSMFHKHVAERIAMKTDDRYEKILTWIRCKISFLVLRSSLMCIRGSRPHSNSKQTDVIDDFELACDDAKLTI